jgi:hypothetical protein
MARCLELNGSLDRCRRAASFQAFGTGSGPGFAQPILRLTGVSCKILSAVSGVACRRSRAFQFFWLHPRHHPQNETILRVFSQEPNGR